MILTPYPGVIDPLFIKMNTLKLNHNRYTIFLFEGLALWIEPHRDMDQPVMNCILQLFPVNNILRAFFRHPD